MGTRPRLDRTILLLLGLILTTGGVLALLTGLGVLGTGLRHRAVFDNTLGRQFGHHGGWLWPLCAIAGLLLGLLFARWLRTQLTPTSTGPLELERPARHGRTELPAHAITDAVTADIRAYRGVTAVHTRLAGTNRDYQLLLRVSLDDRADPATLRSRIQEHAINRMRQALTAQVPVHLDLVQTSTRGARVT